MRVGRQHPDGAERRQALLGDIHAVLLPQPLPANGQPGEIGHGGAADQAAAERFRQAQRSFNCVTAASSIAAAIVSWLSWLFWSVTLTSQSAATAAGVPRR